MTRDLREAIEAVRHDGRSRQARCPAHDDRRSSLSVGHGDDGRVLLHCHAGCAVENVLTAVGLTMADLHGRCGHADKPKIIATYDYHDENGSLVFQVCRFAPKDFRQRRPDGAGGWTWRLGNVRRVLYRLPQLGQERVVYVVEGEKDADRLWSLSLPATTNAGGAGKWRDDYTRQLVASGVGCVAILPDNDEPGSQHAETIARSCQAAGIRVKVVDLPDLPPKGDVSDWLTAGHIGDELISIVKSTRPYEPNVPAVVERKTQNERRTTAQPVLVRLADVRPEPVSWLWPGRIAAGKLALLVGDPGLGKSWITLDIAARVSAARPWPDGASSLPPGDVLLLSAEDGLADTIRPRLDALGADVSRVHHLAVQRAGEHERAVQLADVAVLERAIRDTRARLMIIDPVSAYLGSTDSHRDAEVRSLMAPLAALAERTGVAILGVMHLGKSANRPAVYRSVGSIAFTAAARIVLAVAADPKDDDRRIVAPVKSNLAAPPAALAYTLADGRLTWEEDPVGDVDVDALLAGRPAERQKQSEAEAWLVEKLSGGPMLEREIEREAELENIARRTLRRAKDRLGVESARVGFGRGGQSYWRLPTSKVAVKKSSADRVDIYEQPELKNAEDPLSSSKVASGDAVALYEDVPDTPPDEPKNATCDDVATKVVSDDDRLEVWLQ